jgi:hypothetical protein
MMACPTVAGSGTKTHAVSRNPCFCRIPASAIANRAKSHSSSPRLDRSQFTVIKERAPQPEHATNLRATPCGGNGEPNRRALVGEKPRTYETGVVGG